MGVNYVEGDSVSALRRFYSNSYGIMDTYVGALAVHLTQMTLQDTVQIRARVVVAERTKIFTCSQVQPGYCMCSDSDNTIRLVPSRIFDSCIVLRNVHDMLTFRKPSGVV